MDAIEVANILNRALGAAAESVSFDPIVAGIRDSLASVGIYAHRIQLPMSRAGGFRHPTLGLVLLTWTHDAGVHVETMTHAQLDGLEVHGVVGTPFEGVVLHGEDYSRVALHEEDGGYEILAGLRGQGYRDYVAVGIRMPSGHDPQPLSVASLDEFPDDVGDRLREIAPLFGMALYGVYRASQAERVVRAYIGRDSGPRVLAGEIKRGSTTRETSGILFCDIRGFTAMSKRLTSEALIDVVNQVFQVVGDEAGERGGEILKFIGDAMLLTFPHDTSAAATAAAIVDTARAAIERVRALGAELGLPLAIGFGGHVGEVVRGNIGTTERLDFTVMGPAVNLTSRLEALCKPLQASAVFSMEIARHIDGLSPGGSHSLKGIASSQTVWVLPEADLSA